MSDFFLMLGKLGLMALLEACTCCGCVGVVRMVGHLAMDDLIVLRRGAENNLALIVLVG